jgi:hypothetical protein
MHRYSIFCEYLVTLRDLLNSLVHVTITVSISVMPSMMQKIWRVVSSAGRIDAVPTVDHIGTLAMR